MKILMTESLLATGTDVFDAHPDVEVVTPRDTSEEALIEVIADVDGIAVRSAQLTPAVFAAAPKLRAVARHGVGYDNIHVDSLTQRKIPLLLAITANAVSVAEHTMMFILELAKRARIYDADARRSDFRLRSAPIAVDIAEKTLTIVGFGRIGTRLARRALAFDMDVTVCDPYVNDEVIEKAGCAPVNDFRTVLDRTDFLSVHCPLNDETRHLIDAEALALMRSASFVINCARGGIVDETALVAALDEGRIAGAGIDVFELEPPPADHPFLASDKVLLSPHSAGVSVEAANRMSRETATRLIDALEGNIDIAALANPEPFGRP